MSDNKTAADIIAEKRLRAAEMEKTLGDQHSFVESLKNDADRLDAALRRERGNSAAMYAALMKVKKLFDGHIMFQPAIREAHEVVNAALAAPPRNCDKYATADEALKAQEQMFNDSNFANGECKLGCPECDNPRVGCKIAWLYAPTTEQEGGAK